MEYHYSVFSLEDGTLFHSDIYQYWFFFNGSCTIRCGDAVFYANPHDFLEIPPEKDLLVQCRQPVGIGRVRVLDFHSVNTQIKYLPADKCRLITKVFLFALEMSGICHPNYPVIMGHMDQLMKIFLLGKPDMETPTNPQVEAFLTQVTNRYCDPAFDLSEEIRKTGYSESHFRRIFKEAVGVSPIYFLNHYRIEHARSLMKLRSTASVKTIAQESGFADPDYFARFFKKCTGQTPTEYMASIRYKAETGQNRK